MRWAKRRVKIKLEMIRNSRRKVVEYAENEYNETVELFKKYKDMDKSEFVKLMMKEHPEKYK